MPNIEQHANQLLIDSGIKSAPVPVDKIAHRLGIELKFSPARDDVSGALIRDGNKAAIAVNSAQHENRQRFTIAHEIGHFRLHRQERLHFDDDFQISFRNSLSSEAKDRREIEANQFAAALLMPRDFLRTDIAQFISGGSDPEDAIQSLAAKYAVSKRAMELRLLNLGYISPVDE